LIKPLEICTEDRENRTALLAGLLQPRAGEPERNGKKLPQKYTLSGSAAKEVE
jgi:hypothetical protein